MLAYHVERTERSFFVAEKVRLFFCLALTLHRQYRKWATRRYALDPLYGTTATAHTTYVLTFEVEDVFTVPPDGDHAALDRKMSYFGVRDEKQP